MRKRGEIQSLFYEPDKGADKNQWRRNLELEVMLDIRDLLALIAKKVKKEPK